MQSINMTAVNNLNSTQGIQSLAQNNGDSNSVVKHNLNDNQNKRARQTEPVKSQLSTPTVTQTSMDIRDLQSESNDRDRNRQDRLLSTETINWKNRQRLESDGTVHESEARVLASPSIPQPTINEHDGEHDDEFIGMNNLSKHSKHE